MISMCLQNFVCVNKYKHVIYDTLASKRIKGGKLNRAKVEGSVTNILSGVISSPRILLREIYPNRDFPHDHLRDITHDSIRTGSTSVISPTTHRGLELTWGERKYHDQ